MTKLFVGIDCSTQGIKVTVIDEQLNQVHEDFVNYDSELPKYKTEGGAIKDGLTVTTPTLLWVEALELLFDKLKRSDFPFKDVIAISGSGQQHGSVYWKKGSQSRLQSITTKETLVAQFQDMFSIPNSPIWMDSSTSAHCADLENFLGGPLKVAELTGSTAYERFTIHQIRKLAQTEPDAYKNTERVSLVSSFVCSILVGDYCAIDYGDASGMNALDIKSKEWLDLRSFVGDDQLLDKLGKSEPAHRVAGNVSNFFVGKYGFSSDCFVINFSGDNPCSLAGTRLREGDIAISLGTSDTMFGPLNDPRPSEEGHIFCDPVHPHGYMALLCYKNGSLAREHVRDKYLKSKDWEHFNEALSNTPAGNEGNIGYYFLQTEITPKITAGTYLFNKSNESVTQFDNPEQNVRAIIESQFLSMFVHSKSIGMSVTERILATGGASKNKKILQVMSDVFGVPVYTHSQPNSASLGAAYRALHGWLSRDSKDAISFDAVVAKAASFNKAVDPNTDLHTTVYIPLADRYKLLEGKLLNKNS